MILKLLLFDVLSWMSRFNSVSFKLNSCKLDRSELNEILKARAFLIFNLESFRISLILREMLDHLINGMH